MSKQYELIFCQEGYQHVDFVGTYEQCQDVKRELERDMYLSGERNFYYIIKEAHYD